MSIISIIGTKPDNTLCERETLQDMSVDQCIGAYLWRYGECRELNITILDPIRGDTPIFAEIAQF